MKSLLSIALLMSFSELIFGAGLNSKFDCAFPTISNAKVLHFEYSDFDWKAMGFNSIEEFSAALNKQAADQKTSGFNADERQFTRIYERASLVVEARVNYQKHTQWSDSERIQLLAYDLNKPVSLSFLTVYKNHSNQNLKAGNEVLIDIDSRLLFDKRLNTSLLEFRNGYDNYWNDQFERSETNTETESVVKLKLNEYIETLYSSAWKKLTIPYLQPRFESKGVFCGNKLLRDRGSYLFFLEEDKENKLKLSIGYSIFDSRHKNILDIIVGK